jgi:hypothetical protein
MYASEEDRAVMEKTLKEQPERPRTDGTMRSDHSSLNSNLSPGRMDQQPPIFVSGVFSDLNKSGSEPNFIAVCFVIVFSIALLNRLLNLKDCPKVVSVSGSLVLSCGRLRILGGC